MALVGRYETYEQLGKGSTGTVYRARDGVLGREVALKILNADSRISSRLLELFSQGKHSASELLHPNIAIIYDLGRSTVGPFIAAELLTGATFRSHIRNHCALSLVQKLDLIIQACNGLAHAHKIGLVHAAINPGSFWVDDRQQVRILDLGIRHAGNPMSAAAENSGMSDYLAPEQISEDKCDFRSDIFSAAIVFFQFLVNVHPFSDVFIPRRIADDSPESLFAIDPLAPQSLERLFSQALSKSPEKRPQSAAELGASFRAIEVEVRSSLTPKTEERKAVVKSSDVPPLSYLEEHSNIRTFLGVLRQFDQNISSANWGEAQQLLAQMKALSSGPDNEQFVEAILDSEQRLRRAHDPRVKPAGTITEITRSGVGDLSGAGLRSQPGSTTANSFARLSPGHSLKVQIVATVIVAVLILASALFISQMRRQKPMAILAEARVQIPEAGILQSPADNSPPVATLKEGTWVNIVDQLPARNSDFVHVRSLPGRRGFGEGYVRSTALGDWKSGDADVAWRLLLLTKPSSNSPATEIQRYLADLQTYTGRFPTSQKEQAVEQEQKQWTRILSLTSEAQPMMANGAVADGRDEGALPPSIPPQPRAVPVPLSSNDKEKLQNLLARLPILWDDGNLDDIMDLTRQAITLEPENQSAIAWRSKARKALRKLNDQ